MWRQGVARRQVSFCDSNVDLELQSCGVVVPACGTSVVSSCGLSVVLIPISLKANGRSN